MPFLLAFFFLVDDGKLFGINAELSSGNKEIYISGRISENTHRAVQKYKLLIGPVIGSVVLF